MNNLENLTIDYLRELNIKLSEKEEKDIIELNTNSNFIIFNSDSLELLFHYMLYWTDQFIVVELIDNNWFIKNDSGSFPLDHLLNSYVQQGILINDYTFSIIKFEDENLVLINENENNEAYYLKTNYGESINKVFLKNYHITSINLISFFETIINSLENIEIININLNYKNDIPDFVYSDNSRNLKIKNNHWLLIKKEEVIESHQDNVCIIITKFFYSNVELKKVIKYSKNINKKKFFSNSNIIILLILIMFFIFLYKWKK